MCNCQKRPAKDLIGFSSNKLKKNYTGHIVMAACYSRRKYPNKDI